MGVKKLSSLLRKNSYKHSFEVYHVTEIIIMIKTEFHDILPHPPEIFKSKNSIIQKYSSVFRDDLPPGLSPVRKIDN